MKEQILLFEINDETIRKQFRQALMPLRLRLKFIDQGDYGLTIGELTANETKPGATDRDVHRNAEMDAGPERSGEGSAAEFATESAAESATESAPSLAAPMLVFSGLSSARLDSVLRTLRQKKLFIPHKAVLTPHNAAWTPVQLFEELDQERKRFEEMKR